MSKPTKYYHIYNFLRLKLYFCKKHIYAQKTFFALKGLGWAIYSILNSLIGLVGQPLSSVNLSSLNLLPLYLTRTGHFYYIFFPSLPNVSDHYIIIDGDFNIVQDVCLNRSSTKKNDLV